MEDLFGHRRRRSNHTHQPPHLQHLQYLRDEEDYRNMIAVDSYQHSAISPNSVDVYSRGRSQRAHPLDSSPVSAPPFLQGGGTSGDHTLAYDTAPGSSAGVKSPSTAARFLSSMKRSLSYGAPSKKREASLAERGMHSTPEESLPPSPSSYYLSNSEATRPSIEQIAMGLHISRTPHLSPLSQSQTHRHHHSASSPSFPSHYSTSTKVRRRQTLEYAQPSFHYSAHTPRSAPPMRRPSLQHHRRGSAPPLVLPPPPARSSMKKTSLPTAHPSQPNLPSQINASNSAGSILPRSAASSPLTASTSDVSLSTLPSSAPSTPRSSRSGSMSLFSTKLHWRMARLFTGGGGGGMGRGKGGESQVSTLVTSEDDESTNGSTEVVQRKIVRFDGVGGEDSKENENDGDDDNETTERDEILEQS